ncbi:uncharacterized protein [Battus philenor]|uniref:uncharacterized protein n=1 Tax=Battus philenor TaxID=42288 RepID=UPI0035CEF153
MGSNCCKGDAAGRPVKSRSSIYSRSRAGASLDDRFIASEDARGVRLTVSAARTSDSGVFTLQASNAAGKDTRRLCLEVSADETPTGDDPPTFLRRLQDLTVKVGTRTRFLVEIISSTECKVTWYRNERRLMEAEHVALVRDGNFWCADVATVSVDDAGRWTCTAENAGGRASCSAHLNVLVPKAYKRPEFVEELRALLTEQGTVSLECKVVGVPTPVLRWFKDSCEIKAGDVFALTANAEDPTSLGTYTCEAFNCMGRAYSSSKVHVIGRGTAEGLNKGAISSEPPPIFTKELEGQTVKICDPLTLSCHIVVPPWPRSVVWYNKEGKIEANERYHVIEDGVGGYLIEVSSTEWRDEGEWKCVATSSGGRLGISTCYVIMEVPKNFRKPRFMENLQAVLTEEGLVSFECKVVGFPTPSLSWFKDGQELKPGDVYQLTGTNSLGSYCCIARNCMGQASSSAELTVDDIQNQLNEEEKLQLFSKNQAPRFIQGLKSVEAKIDEPFRFVVKVACPPEPSVFWYRDDQPVDESTRCHLGKEERGGFFLVIQNLEFLDQAEWKCVAMNDFGHSVTSCFLKLIIPRHYKKPRFLENLQAILSEEGAVNLECKVIGVPQPILKWYKDGEELKPGDIHRIISGQDGTCCLGTYTCEAQNCMGIAASSASLLGFGDSIKTKNKTKTEEQILQRNLSLSTIHEERTSQMYDTPVGDITLDDKGEISFSFDGKEVSVSLYETPDLTEEEALQIVEMYADQLSENITEHNVVELPPLRFVKETSTSGNLLMEAIIIDVSPEYFASPEEDLRTEADVEEISIADENGLFQLPLDQDVSGEERAITGMEGAKPVTHRNLNRKKSDSQRSCDDYFSLSREQSLSEEKKYDDYQPMSESDLQSFVSAHSSAKLTSKVSKAFSQENNELLEEMKITDIHQEKVKRESSVNFRRSSSGSEKSETKSRKKSLEKQMKIQQEKSVDNLEDDINNMKSNLVAIIKYIQNLEKETILKSELMSSVATASKSLEIISSVLSPLSDIHGISNAFMNSIINANSDNSLLINNMVQSLKLLQHSLTIVEKCIEVESDNRTLVKKTCISLIELCGNQLQNLMSQVKTVITGIAIEDKVLSETELITNEINTILNFTMDTIKTKNLLKEACELQAVELSFEVKHLRETQKGLYQLKIPLISLLGIVENAEKGLSTDVLNVHNSTAILADMSASIQDLQSALEQIELLSMKETSTSLNKYNNDIIDSVVQPVLELRNSFEQLTVDSKAVEDTAVLKQKLKLVKSNLNDIFVRLNVTEENIGTFDILQSENKLDTLQIMAQTLISLENNLPRLDSFPSMKSYMNSFHKLLTNILENVIESNDSTKYFNFMDICVAVKRINNSIHDIDSQCELSLSSVNNTLNIIRDCFERNVYDHVLNKSILTNIHELQICVQQMLNEEKELSNSFSSRYVQDMSENVPDENRANIVIEYIDRTLAAIYMVTSLHSPDEQTTLILPALERICPILEELKHNVASLDLGEIKHEEHISEITDVSSQAAGTLAKPLYDLNCSVSILNEIMYENPDSFKGSYQQTSTCAQPLNELCRTLETIQHNVVSQLGDDLTPYELDFDFANTIQGLHSAILMIYNNIGLEVPNELSSLEDISGLKTTVETVRSDDFTYQIIKQNEIRETVEINQLPLVELLQKLNEHVITLQSPEIVQAIDKFCEIRPTLYLRFMKENLYELYSSIKEILRPNRLTAIAKHLLALHQSLSEIDTTTDIPVFEAILDASPNTLHSFIQVITEAKNYVEKCAEIIPSAIEITDNTIEAAMHVKKLKDSCQFLRNYLPETMYMKKCVPLDVLLNNFLDSVDIFKDVIAKQIEISAEELYENIFSVQEEVLSLVPLSIEEMEQEALVIQTLNEIESFIPLLEKFAIVRLIDRSKLYSCASLTGKNFELDELLQLQNILTTVYKKIQDCTEHSDNFMKIKQYIKTCEWELSILKTLVTKNLTCKRVLRLYQGFDLINSTIYSLDLTLRKSKISDETKSSVDHFINSSRRFMENYRSVLIEIFENQMKLIFDIPLSILVYNCDTLELLEAGSFDFTDIVQQFLELKGIVLPSLISLDMAVITEMKSKNSDIEKCTKDNTLVAWINFQNIVEQILSKDFSNAEYKPQLLHLMNCIQKHRDSKISTGLNKHLLLLKCMSEFSIILKQIMFKNNWSREPRLQKEPPLIITLSDIHIQLAAFHKHLTELQEKKIENVNTSVFLDVALVVLWKENLIKIHKDLINYTQRAGLEITSKDKCLCSELIREIYFMQNTLNVLNDDPVTATAAVKHLITVLEEVEKSITLIYSSDEVECSQNIIKGQLVQHIEEFLSQGCVDLIKTLPLPALVTNAEECIKVATELKESIAAASMSQDNSLAAPSLEEAVDEHNAGLVLELQQAVAVIQSVIQENAEEFSSQCKDADLQRVDSILSNLSSDLIGIVSSEQVKEQIAAVKQSVEVPDAVAAPAKIIAESGKSEDTNLGALVQHIEEFLSEGCVELVKTLPVPAIVTNAEECIKVATELKESIAAASVSQDNSLAAPSLKEAVDEHNAGLVLELQQAVAVIQSVIQENAEEFSSQCKDADLQRVDSILGNLSSDLMGIVSSEQVKEQIAAVKQSVEVPDAVAAPAEIIEESVKSEDTNLGALVQHIEEFLSEGCVELVKTLPLPAIVTNAEECIKVATELKESIAAASVSQDNSLAAPSLKEAVDEHNAGLVLELQQAVAVIQSVIQENAEEFSSQCKDADLQRVDSILGNLSSDLMGIVSSEQVTEQIAAVKQSVEVPDAVAAPAEITAESGKSEDTNLGALVQHIEEFLSEGCVELVKTLPMPAIVTNAEECIKVATELKESIAAASVSQDNSLAAPSLKEAVDEHNAGLVLELQQAVAVIQSVIQENAEEFSSQCKDADLQRVDSILSNLSSDLMGIVSSEQVKEQIAAVKQSVEVPDAVAAPAEIIEESVKSEDTNLGALVQHIEEFLSEGCVELVKTLPVPAIVTNAEECIKVATELKESIAAASVSQDNSLAAPSLKEAVDEHNAGLVLELQQAVAVIQSVIKENAEEFSSQCKDADLQRVDSILGNLSSDLMGIVSSEQVKEQIAAVKQSVEVPDAVAAPAEITAESGKSEDTNLGALVQHIEEFLSEGCVELVKTLPMPAIVTNAEECIKVATELKESIAAASVSQDNSLAAPSLKEAVDEHNAGLVLELQQAVAVIQSVIQENAEEFSSQCKDADLQRVDSILSNLSSNLMGIVSSEQVKEQIAAVKQSVEVPDAVAAPAEITAESGKSEDTNLGALVQHIEEFLSEGCVELVKTLPVPAIVTNAEECIKVATELKESIAAASVSQDNSLAAPSLKEAVDEHNAGLVLELQQAVAVIQSVIQENAEEFSSQCKDADLQRVDSILSNLSSDLMEIVSSEQVKEQIAAVKQSVEGPDAVAAPAEIIAESVKLEDTNLGALVQHIEEFLSEGCVELVKTLPMPAIVTNAEECIKVATELKESIAAASVSQDNSLAAPSLKEVVDEHNAGLVLELQQAVAVIQSVIQENAEEFSSQCKDADLQRVDSILSNLSSDLMGIVSSEQVKEQIAAVKQSVEAPDAVAAPAEITAESGKSEDTNLGALVQHIEEFLSEGCVELVKTLPVPAIVTNAEECIKVATELKESIAAASVSQDNSLAAPSLKEAVDEHNAGLVLELQQAVAVIQSVIQENAEEFSSQCKDADLQRVDSILSNLSSDLMGIVSSEQVKEQIAAVKQSVEIPDAVAAPAEIIAESVKSEDTKLGALVQHIEEFLSEGCVELVKTLPMPAIVTNAEECIKVATELKESIAAASVSQDNSLAAPSLKEAVDEHNAGLVLELQQAVAVIQSVIQENAEEFSSQCKDADLQRVDSILSNLSSDLMEIVSSEQVKEQIAAVKQSVEVSDAVAAPAKITAESGKSEDTNLGALVQHIEEFLSEGCVELVKTLPMPAIVTNAEECIKVATELKESIAAASMSQDNSLAAPSLKEAVDEHNAGLVLELQQAVAVIQSVIQENAEEFSSQCKDADLQRVDSILSNLSSDLIGIVSSEQVKEQIAAVKQSVEVPDAVAAPAEIIEESVKSEDTKLGALVQHIEEFLSEGCVELVKTLPMPAIVTNAEECIKVATELKESIAAASVSQDNSLAAPSLKEVVDEHNAGLVLELQQAVAVIQSVIQENAEEFSSQCKDADLQRVDSILSNLSSDLMGIVSSEQVKEQIAAVKQSVEVPDAVAAPAEITAESGKSEDTNLGALVQHIEEFLSEGCVELVKTLPMPAIVTNAEECIKVATELKESIAAASVSQDNSLAAPSLKEAVDEHNAGLVLELQQAVAVIQSVIQENAEEFSSQCKDADLQRVDSILSNLSSDLMGIVSSEQVKEQIAAVKQSVEVPDAVAAPAEITAESGKSEDTNLGALVQHIEEFLSEGCVELVKTLPMPAIVTNAEECIKVATELKESIAAASVSQDNSLAAPSLKEVVDEHNAGLVLELQQAVAVIQSVIQENAEEFSSQCKDADLQRVDSILSNLSSDLMGIVSSEQVKEQIAAVKQSVEAPDAVAAPAEITAESGKSEDTNLGALVQHIEEFLSEGCVELVKTLPVPAIVTNAEECIKVATELKESIAAASVSQDNSLAAPSLKEAVDEHNAGLVLELQQAVAVIQSVIQENAEEFSSQCKDADLQRVDSILSNLSSDLMGIVSSEQVKEQIAAVKQSVEVPDAVAAPAEIIEESVKSEDTNLGALVQHIEEFLSEGCVELVKTLPVPAIVTNAEECIKVATELKESIAAASVSQDNSLAAPSLKEAVDEHNAGLVLELQQAVAVIQSVIQENAEEFSSQCKDADLQRVDSILSNLSSDLIGIVSSEQVKEQIAAVKQSVEVPDAVAAPAKITAESGKSEDTNLGALVHHIEEFLSEGCVELVKTLPVPAIVTNAEECIKVATELKESIAAASVSQDNSLAAPSLKEAVDEHNAGLVLELQQAVAVIQSVIQENAEEFSSQCKDANLQRVDSILSNLSSDLMGIVSSEQVKEQIATVKQSVEGPDAVAAPAEIIAESVKSEDANLGALVQHIEEFLSEDCVDLVKTLPMPAIVTNAEECIKVATELKESIAAASVSPDKLLAAKSLNETVAKYNAGLVLDLQQAVSVTQSVIHENAEEFSSQVKDADMLQVESTLTDIMSPISPAQVKEQSVNVKQPGHVPHSVEISAEIALGRSPDVDKIDVTNIENETKDGSLQKLNRLLREVCDKINMSAAVRTLDDVEILQDTLDEIQAIIIELKRDFDRSVNDTLSEALEDLECSVRSVQLQINEDSSTELLKEACASLQLLVNNMCEIQKVQMIQTLTYETNLENIIRSCASDSEITVNLLESGLNFKHIDQTEYGTLLQDFNNLKNIIKSLKSIFYENTETLIEKGIEIMNSIDQVEERVFALEKKIDTIKNLNLPNKDSMITAIHSVYSTISNMRSAIMSVQKHYMFENYGKPSELILTALKSVHEIANEFDDKWKKLAKSLRKVLNHFEDIKFYINLDKTARLPNDSAFTKIILRDLNSIIKELILDNKIPVTTTLEEDTKLTLNCIEDNLNKMECQANLEVKDKIPIFKSVAQNIYSLAESIKEYLLIDKRYTNENLKDTEFSLERHTVDSPVPSSAVEINFVHESQNVEKSGSVHSDANFESESNTENLNINTYLPDFALHVIPETLLTINIPEAFILKLEETRPLAVLLPQKIETHVLYEVQVSEAMKDHLSEAKKTEDEAIICDINKLNNNILESIQTKESVVGDSNEKLMSDQNCSTLNYEKDFIKEEKASIESLNRERRIENVREESRKSLDIDSNASIDIQKRTDPLGLKENENDTREQINKSQRYSETFGTQTNEVPNVKNEFQFDDHHDNLNNLSSKTPQNAYLLSNSKTGEEVDNLVTTDSRGSVKDLREVSSELPKTTEDMLNMSEIRRIEVNNFKDRDRDQIPEHSKHSNADTECISNSRPLFVEHTKKDYENDFLKPPSYIRKTFKTDYQVSDIETASSSSFYKAQTLLPQYKSNMSPYSSNNYGENKYEGDLKKKTSNMPQNVSKENRSNIFRENKRKPTFSTHLTDRKAVEGSRVKLTCSVLTSAEPNIVWYKNGVPLNNKLKYKTKNIDGLLTMEVLNATPSDSAEYSCTVETESGTVSTSANLKVYPSFEASPIPPTFTRSIRDTYHLAENELVLECRIRGQPLPTITWLKDDHSIESNERYQAYYLADGVCRLAISNPTQEDSGKFTCQAENSVWSDQISHIVSFTAADKDGHTGMSLTPSARSLNRQIMETRKPHFTNVLTDYKVTRGGTIGLQVEIKGSPTRVEWLREGRFITDVYRNAQTFIDHSLYTLALSDVTENESGVYTCRAWGSHGKVDMNAAITVIHPNQIDGKPAVIIGRPQKEMLISVGEDLNISFRAQGEPKPKVIFMKGIRDISNSQRVCKMTSDDYVKFTLKRAVVSDAGTYCILVRNAYGCDRSFVTVVVRQRASSENLISDWTYPIDDSTLAIVERKYKTAPTRIPGEPSVVGGGNTWISLAWSKADVECGPPVLAYKIESWLLGKEGGARWVELGITPLNTFEAFNLKQGEEYHFRVTPRNRYGWGESVQTSTPVGVGLAGDRPEFEEILPGQLKVLVGQTATLKCSFKGRPIPEIVWMKNGHEIDEEDGRLKTSLNDYTCCLTIDNVRVEDEARYSCEATNVHGRASTYARVAVITDPLIWEADAKLKRERSADVDGDFPPQFTMRLRDRRVQATYPVRLTCQLIGRPSPLVTWYKNDQEVINDDRHTKSQDELFHTLEIAPSKLEDGGVYEVTARNSCGAISCRCNLVVDKGIRAYIAPEFCCGLEPLYQLSIGDELRISAVVEAYPSVGVTWYRDGVRLRPSRRAVMTLDRDGQIELAVASVTQRDAGVYTCTASNEVGKASTSGKVEVVGESVEERNQSLPTLICHDVPYSKVPMFIRKPRSSEAREGDTVIIECEVIGDPKPDVYWLRDFLKPDYYRDASHFKRVGAGPEYRFEIPHAKLDYTGAYSVVAKNVHGEAKAVISLQILAKDPNSPEDAHNVRYGRVEVIPRFEKELTDLLSHDGDAVEFECRITGSPEPDVKWYHYAEIIRESEDFQTSLELGAARLKIKQVTADDEGTYTCEAYNSMGKATSSACLVVYPAGEPNTLSQRLRRPPALLSALSTPRSTPARSLSRTRTPGPDMRCLVSPARETAPKFYTYPFNKVAEEGDTVVFQCAVRGLPAPWATWDKDGIVITPSSRITIKEKDELLRILEIEEVNSEDVGLYRVTLENDYGRAEASARLEVISQKGKFYTGSRSYSASPKRSTSYRRSMCSLPRQD